MGLIGMEVKQAHPERVNFIVLSKTWLIDVAAKHCTNSKPV